MSNAQAISPEQAINVPDDNPAKGLSKGAAFGIHLALSLLIFSSLIAMMLLFWFPGKLFFLDGGWEGLKLVAMVDLVLGPALTLILYKPGKKGLLMDMSMIALLQIAALGYGFYTTYHQRTVAVVYSEQGFGTLSASDHAVANTKLVDLDLQPYQIPKAQLLKIPMYLTPEPNSADYAQFLANLFNGYPGPRERSDQYVAIDSRPDELGKGIMTTEVLAEQGILAAVKKAANENKVQLKDIHVYKFQARYDKGVLLFDPKTHRIVDYVSWDLATEQVAEAES